MYVFAVHVGCCQIRHQRPVVSRDAHCTCPCGVTVYFVELHVHTVAHAELFQYRGVGVFADTTDVSASLLLAFTFKTEKLSQKYLRYFKLL